MAHYICLMLFLVQISVKYFKIIKLFKKKKN